MSFVRLGSFRVDVAYHTRVVQAHVPRIIGVLPKVIRYLCAWGNVAVHEVKPRRDYCWLKTISNPPLPLAPARLANF